MIPIWKLKPGGEEIRKYDKVVEHPEIRMDMVRNSMCCMDVLATTCTQYTVK